MLKIAISFFFIFILNASAEVLEPCKNSERSVSQCQEAQSAYDSALEQAKFQNKLLFVIFGSKNCGPCNAWKGLLPDFEDDFVSIYFPLKMRRGPTKVDNIQVKKICESIRTSEPPPPARYYNKADSSLNFTKDMPGCTFYPIMYVINPKDGAIVEVDPSSYPNGKDRTDQQSSAYLRDLAFEIRDANQGDCPPSEPVLSGAPTLLTTDGLNISRQLSLD